MKMKQSFFKKLAFFATMLALLMLAACSGGGEKASTGGNNEGNDKEQTFKLRMNSTYTPPIEGSPTYIAQEEFAELVKEKTNGRVEIEIFYSNQLAGQSESLDALARGTFDIQVTTPVAWADRIPEGNWSAMPYAWKSEEHLRHLLRNTEVGELYSEALGDYGVKPLHYYFSASTGFLSKKPITKPEDANGMVIASVGSLLGDYYKAMGAGTANIPFSDYYEALLRGTIDAIAFPYYSLESMKLAEVVDYITIPGGQSPSFGVIVISQLTWDKLPSDLQDSIMEASLEIEEKMIPASRAFTDRGIEYAKEQGLEVVETTDEVYQEFVEIAKETYWAGFADINERSKRMIEVIEENLDYQE
ncbi:TRAP transporter substrate-binding protein [Bacillus dakarensis]|uniref:TRAP transporter substrate-binding protein n=1 Tax=Robertmurraya dakarensis TaxID=1926278 RepID=UPI0009810EA3|nr:TRAP transporter substrate-binding protein [Bacillus dakarensis]